MKNRTLKFATAILIITLISFGCLCSMAATCGPVPISAIYNLSMVEFRDEGHGAYFLKAERGGDCYGYITDSSGQRVETFFEVGYNDILSVTPVFRSGESAYFYADMVYDSENSTLTCTVRDDLEAINIDFTELVFVVSEVDNSALRPYDLITARWSDENDAFNLTGMYYPYTSRTCMLRCYMLDGGNIVYGAYDFVWHDGGFEILDGEECIASGEYDFDYNSFAVTFTFITDNLYGDDKPFASYPALTLYTDWTAYYGN